MKLLQIINNKIFEARQRAKQRAEAELALVAAFNDAVIDGQLSDDEFGEIDSWRCALNLNWHDIEHLTVGAYKIAFDIKKGSREVTSKDEADLLMIQQAFEISDEKIAIQKKELARFRIITDISNGCYPGISVRGLVFQRGELAYWKESASLLEERVLDRRYSSWSSGSSFRVSRGISFSSGHSHGYSYAVKGVIPVSEGELIVTNKRLIFRGSKKSVNLRLDKLLEVEFFRDGMRFTNDRGKASILRFGKRCGDIEIISEILVHAINGFS